MQYRASGNKISIHVPSLKLNLSTKSIIQILSNQGFRLLNTTITTLAQEQIGKPYTKRAKISEAPHTFDCSSLTKWLYGQVGIWIPRYAIDQKFFGSPAKTMEPGDLVFTKGKRGYYWDNPDQRIGHVGIVTENNTIIHAANTSRGVVEDSFSHFIAKHESIQAVRRILLKNHVLSFEFPAYMEIETSTDVRWNITQQLKTPVS